MAALRGVLASDTSDCSRLSTNEIVSTLNTHGGQVTTWLFKNGDYKVFVNSEYVAKGNVNQQKEG